MKTCIYVYTSQSIFSWIYNHVVQKKMPFSYPFDELFYLPPLTHQMQNSFRTKNDIFLGESPTSLKKSQTTHLPIRPSILPWETKGSWNSKESHFKCTAKGRKKIFSAGHLAFLGTTSAQNRWFFLFEFKRRIASRSWKKRAALSVIFQQIVI